jgi:hypothetical protein
MRNQEEKTSAELLKEFFELVDQEPKPPILKIDDQGRFILDWNNPHHREWYFDQ